MSLPILATKLYIPPPRTRSVPRARLVERLNASLDRKLTLISASVGFGKTTLVSEWVAGCGRSAAWLSLDEEDNDLTRFLTYLIAALQTVAPGVGGGVVSALTSTQPPATQSLLTGLLNDLSALPHKIVLVLDDYHVIDSRPIDDTLTFLLEHLPPQLHLVIATRENPQFPLGRLRARGLLTELRATDLRFTPDEAAAFLNQVVGLGLSQGDIAALESRTEGWIAGLQLASLSMQGRNDMSAFIRAFAGDNRYIVDYLLEEVLQRQPDHVRSFLLQTSILDRLYGPLCDAVTEQADGSSRLEALERGNFFLVPLDDKRQWYRYHHLFAEVLSVHLRTDHPDRVAALHRRASRWYELHDSAAEPCREARGVRRHPSHNAIRHAVAAGDFARAADLVELACPALSRSRQEGTLLGWMKALPDEVVRCRPVLSAQYAGVMLSCGLVEGVADRLRDAEAPPAEMVVVDEEAFRQLPGIIAMYRAGHGLALGDLQATSYFARQVLDLAAEDDHLRRGAAVALLGLASWTNGDLEEGHRMFAEGMASLQKAGNISDAVGGLNALADIKIAQGELRQVMRTYERGLQLAAEHGEPAIRGTADMYVGMGEVFCEWNNLDAATQHLLKSKEQGEHTGFPQYPHRWRVAMARIRVAQGDLNAALDLLGEAERLYVSNMFPNVRPIAALKARVWVAQGRLDEALGWAREQELTAHDQLSYLREFEHITLARVLLARQESDRAEAMELLERLLKAAEAGGRAGSAIEILILQALAHQMQGDIRAALVSLERALSTAEPEGYVRIFVDEGQPMAALLEAALKQGIAREYVRRLLTAFGTPAESTEVKPTANVLLSEPLSERERDVLRLLGTDLSGPEMASQLIVSLNTLRTHTKNIYDKLGVNNRRAAVRRAEELGL